MWTYNFDARNNLSILRNGLVWSACKSTDDISPIDSAVSSIKHLVDLVPGMIDDAQSTVEKAAILKMMAEAVADIQKVLEFESFVTNMLEMCPDKGAISHRDMILKNVRDIIFRK
jgi:hypothetical protein